mgnify:CR=1 FL=1
MGIRILIFACNHSVAQIQHLVDWLKHMNLDVHVSEGKEFTILGLVGDTSRVDIELLGSLEIVESVKRVSEPFKQVNRKFHPNDSVIEAGQAKIGHGNFAMIAGPCSVESEEQVMEIAKAVKAARKSGAKYFLVEQDNASKLPDTLGQVERSIRYINEKL